LRPDWLCASLITSSAQCFLNISVLIVYCSLLSLSGYRGTVAAMR
jgi:hypothetical protein